jgi:hypothetical protein
MSALDAALRQIDDIASDGDLAPIPPPVLPAIDPDDAGGPVELPDGRTIYVPRLHGRRVGELASALLDLERPADSKFLRLTGPPGTGRAGSPGRSPWSYGAAAGSRSSTGTANRSTASWRSPAAPRQTSTCSATSSSPPPTARATSGWSTPRSWPRCAPAGRR